MMAHNNDDIKIVTNSYAAIVPHNFIETETNMNPSVTRYHNDANPSVQLLNEDCCKNKKSIVAVTTTTNCTNSNGIRNFNAPAKYKCNGININLELARGGGGGGGNGCGGGSGIRGGIGGSIDDDRCGNNGSKALTKLNGSNSIKASQSMTSLPPNEQQEASETIEAKLRVERPYNSLKKKRNSERDTLRHSWGSGNSHSSCSLHSNANGFGLASGKDDFWAALQTNYNYIMDTNLLDTCKEARCEIEGAASVIENRSNYGCKMMETSRIEGSSEDPKELRKWLRDMENKLSNVPSLLEATHMSIAELQRRLTEHSVLYYEIVSHARVVGACIKASEKENHINEQQQQQQNISRSPYSVTDDNSGIRLNRKTPSPSNKKFDGNLKGLERRYHLLYLKAIEVQCLFEGLLGKKTAANIQTEESSSIEDTDDEPASKLARLSDSESGDIPVSPNNFRGGIVAKARTNPDISKFEYEDADNEEEEEDKICEFDWSHLSFSKVLKTENFEEKFSCVENNHTTSATDFDADSEGSDCEILKRRRSFDKYNNYRLINNKTIKNDTIIICENMDDNLLMQKTKGVVVNDRSLIDINNHFITDQKSSIKPIAITAVAAAATTTITTTTATTIKSLNNCNPNLNRSTKLSIGSGVNCNSVIGGVTSGVVGGNNSTTGVRKRQRNVDISKFNRSNRKSKNCAIFYFKHLDTDNETNFGALSSSHGSDILKSGEQSSDDDEGWRYSNIDCIDGLNQTTKNVLICDDSDKENKENDSALATSSSSASSSSSTSSAPSTSSAATSSSATSLSLATSSSIQNNNNNNNNNNNSSVGGGCGVDVGANNNLSTENISNLSSTSSTGASETLIVNDMLKNSTESEIEKNSASVSSSNSTTNSIMYNKNIIVVHHDTNGNPAVDFSSPPPNQTTNGHHHGQNLNGNYHKSIEEINQINSLSRKLPRPPSFSSIITNNPHNDEKEIVVVAIQLSSPNRSPISTALELPPSKEISHDSIKKLVSDADHLVRDEALKTPNNKQQQKQQHSLIQISSTIKKREVNMPGPTIQRVKEWLEHQPDSSKSDSIPTSVPTTDCEASGEASESDSVGRVGSDSSDGLTDSVATCMQTGSTSNCNSTEIIGGSVEPMPTTVGSNQSLNVSGKVIRRQNRRKSDRPWSVSCLSQLTSSNVPHLEKCSKNQSGGLATHSISESALDSLSPGHCRNVQPTTPVKNSDSKGSLKRRKTRKKKQIGKRSESGSGEGLLGYDLPKLTQSLIKSESISGKVNIIQDLTTALTMLKKSKETLVFDQQQLESEDEENLMKPNFRVGSYTTAYMTNESKLGSLAALATYMNEDEQTANNGEINTGTEDHHSSFSETAWDNYQEKYNSENYSEGFDSDAARRLMEFGDDYRNFMDSQSDCCSSLSAANNLESFSPPRMDSLQQNETKICTQESGVDHARRRRALELEYERRRKTLEMKRKSSQDLDAQLNLIRSPSTSVASSTNLMTPKNNEKHMHASHTDSPNRKLDFGLSHSSHSLRRTSESDTSSRRRKLDERRRSSRTLDKTFKILPTATSSSNEEPDDEREMKNLLEQSRIRLEDTTSLKIRSHLLRPEDYAEIISTCRDNIRCLEAVLRGPPSTVLSVNSINDTKDLLSSWDNLLGWSENAAGARKLQEEMIILKTSLNRLGGKLAFDLDSDSSIQLAIDELKNEKVQLQTYRTSMLRLNASVHSWLTRQEMRLQKELNEQQQEENLQLSSGVVAITSSETIDSDINKDNNENAMESGDGNAIVSVFDKEKALQINTIVHSESEFHKHLKEEVSEMYSSWDEADARINSQLELLTTSLIAWRQLECGLFEFHQVLGKDRGTLRGLEGVLNRGQKTSVELAQNVKLVAKLLSEKVDVSQQQLTAIQEQLDPSRILNIAQFTSSNGSLSDSGISDGGTTSDGGLSERERRLGVLRRLAKQLESALAPGSDAMKSIAIRMETAEAELKTLQNTCRELIVRTAVSQTNNTQNGQIDSAKMMQVQKSKNHSPQSKRKNKRNNKSMSHEQQQTLTSSGMTTTTTVNKTKVIDGKKSSAYDDGDPDDPSDDLLESSDDDKSKPKSGWIWRIAKIAVPMQLALLAIFCAACLMQPNCCDNLNNLSMSFTPQLRYIRGPPPI